MPAHIVARYTDRFGLEATAIANDGATRCPEHKDVVAFGSACF